MSLEAIRELSRESGLRAAEEGLSPYVVFPDEVGDITTLRYIPALGDYSPEGWREVGVHFVDSTGLGLEGEPALTAQAFANRLVSGHGYGIGDVGQFQLYVREFVRM